MISDVESSVKCDFFFMFGVICMVLYLKVINLSNNLRIFVNGSLSL